MRATAYGTDCYPNRRVNRKVKLSDLPYAVLLDPRNAYQNYNCAVNLSNKTIYTYMGVLKPKAGNANYATAGQLSPLLNDPYYLTLGLGTRIFLGGAQGYIIGPGSQHKPSVKRGENGVPLSPAGTLMVMGDLKEMNPRWLAGVSMLGYGCSLAVGIGIPIPVLNEEIARFTGVSDEEIFTQIIDGFRVERFMRPMSIGGRDGGVLPGVWRDGPFAYQAVAVPRFPNLFMLNGPNGPVGNFSLIKVAELQMAYVLALIRAVQAQGGREASPSDAAMARFDAERRKRAEHTIWNSGCRSWYLDASGLPTAWPWTFDRFREEMAAPRLPDYDIR